jgi:putative DNA primase/helicase
VALGSNYDDVMGQLREAGLQVDHLEIGRMRRCKVEGDREKRGWYSLHELRTDSGELLIVGTYGVWRGSDSNTQKVEVRKSQMSADQRAALKARIAEDRKAAERERARAAEAAARRAAAGWAKAAPEGTSEYLVRKGVGAHGVRFGGAGEVIIPLLDVDGRVHGLQIIRAGKAAAASRRPAKEFWPGGLAKKGHFFVLGSPAASAVILIAEGYATAASLHEATGLCTVVAWDAGNLMPVAQALAKRYKRAKLLICGEDDRFRRCQACKKLTVDLIADPETCPSCGKAHGARNEGMLAASVAALAVNGAWCVPAFADDVARRSAFFDKQQKLADFNDLHLLEGLHVVRRQLEARLAELGWDARGRAPSAPSTTQGEGGAAAPLKPLQAVDDLLRRYSLIYAHGSTAFDHDLRVLLSLGDMRDACANKYIHRAWMEHPDRRMVRIDNVGFDPTERDPMITCNLWAGWPTTPAPGSCDKLLELLRYMCSGEQNAEALYQWVLRWVAMPIQRPGTKMKTTLVIHGGQGTGKNLFFETVMRIYGSYGRVLDQDAIEDKFNDWASKKLFLIADEVIARSDVHHVKNKLKGLITGTEIRINPKNVASYTERNHVNLVFLSNELMPVVLEEDDRRHAVIWTPKKLGPEFYAEVMAEIENGGTAALHDYLMHVDLADFNPGTPPPKTEARDALIGLALDSVVRWHRELVAGELIGLKASPCLSADAYEAYKLWCVRSGHRPAPMSKFVPMLERREGVEAGRVRYLLGQTTHGPHGVLRLGNAEFDASTTAATWWGEHIVRFRQGLNDYRGQGGHAAGSVE